MKNTAEIFAFRGKELKTVRDLSGAQLALFHDMKAGRLSAGISRCPRRAKRAVVGACS